MLHLLDATRELATITAAHTAPWTLRTEHEILGADEQRRELLARLKAGESFELYLDLVAFSQAPGVRNRNFVRFARLDAMAATGKGTVFLQDHDQRRMASVGGTIVESKLEANGAALELHQTALLVETWALRAALLGLMRGFSIGWNPIPAPGQLAAEIHCTICQAPVRNCLFDLGHWRGRAVAGQVVEWEFQAAELLETSAVPIPAVRETRPLDVREPSASALAAELSLFGVTVDVPCALNKDTPDMKEIALALGLAADATEAAILAAIADRDAQIAKLAGEHDAAAARAQLAESKAQLALEQQTKTADELAAERARAWADGLVQAGKLTSPEGKLYDHLVAQHKRDPEHAEELARAMPVVTPVARKLQTEGKAETPAAAAADGTPDYAALAGKLNPHDQELVRISKCSAADYVRANYTELAREYGWPERSN